MALKVPIDLPSSVSQLGKLDFGNNYQPGLTLRWRRDTETTQHKVCRCSMIRGPPDATQTQTKNGTESRDHLSWPSDESDTEEPVELQKKFNIPSRQLSINNLSISDGDCSKIRIAYKGAPGAFSETAALKAYPLSEMVPCDQFESAFQAVELWLVNKAILPIESSVGGSFHRNYDLLLRHKLHIVGEVKMAIQLCLLGLPGVRKEELKRVLSHPQALAQSRITLSKLNVVKESVDDTAGAAQFVGSNKLRDTGAVSSARAAEIYGLDILADKIEDDPDNNVTRFLILSREPVIPRTDRPFKTSIVFTLEEGAGTLCKALAVFAMRSINLIKIESRPQRKRPLRAVDDSDNGNLKYFDYLFYIDFEASMAEPHAQNALQHLQEFSTFLRVLGCYPIDTAFQ